MKDVKMKFRHLNIRYDDGKTDLKYLLEVEKIFNIKFPPLYIELMSKHNGVRAEEDCFDYYDCYNNTTEFTMFAFHSFETEENPEPMNNILSQYLYDDEEYGYPYVFEFGSTGEGDWVCFDYRDDPTGNEPKICLVIHDEYDRTTGKHILFPVAENFEQFLDSLYELDWGEVHRKLGITE